MPETLDETLTTADIVNPAPNTVAQGANATRRADSDHILPAAATRSDAEPLFPNDELQQFRTRWDQVQTSFVDEPRTAVERADSLVANVVKRIADQFAAERASLESQWAKGDDVTTEELRQSLKRYRSLFDRLLTF